MYVDDFRSLVRFEPGAMTKVNLFESHRLFADLYCLLPGQSQRVHTHHDNDKLYHVLEGVGVFQSGEEERTVGAGGVVVASAGEPHGVRNESMGGLVVLVVMAPHPKPPAHRTS